MEIAAGGVASLETDLLQLNEVSPLALKSNSDFVEKIFHQWLSLPESNRLVLVKPKSHALIYVSNALRVCLCL
ncbi:uncharacterized protein J3R85_011125 [Psidium guajava]|nr:uncharacterized protein J3R85_011125 [Psidium guajava]